MRDESARLQEATAILRQSYLIDGDDNTRLLAEESFEKVAIRIAELVRETEAAAGYLVQRASEIAERKARLAGKAERYRNALDRAMECIGLKRIAAAELTIARVNKAPKVVVTDMAVLPEDCIRKKDPEPNLVEIKRRIKAGEKIAGVELSNGGSTISITID